MAHIPDLNADFLHMLASSLLIKKREGHSLADDEIRFLIDGFCKGEVADYQMSALAMAICLRGMDRDEITTLTSAMLESGDRLPRSASSDRPRVDKHSTGGIGDKVSLILAPLLAACDVHVPMISGRGLGITGGTLDKLESIPGFRTQIGMDESTRILEKVGTFIIGADQRIAPADRRLYALRDVTGTVESVPLITASILSKKLAASLDALVMDVKTGSGAFMQTHSTASALAHSIVRVGTQFGLPTVALLTDMDQPLGTTIGNAIEVQESIEVLTGAAGVVRELTIELCASLLLQSDMADSIDDARTRLATTIDSGAAMERFERMVHAQGGDLPKSFDIAAKFEITATESGYIAAFDSRLLGETVVAMGGGRRKQDDSIDHSVGIEVHRRVGDRVDRGDTLFALRCPAELANGYAGTVREAVRISDAAVEPKPLILQRIDSTDDQQQTQQQQ
jgi:pyrimidine-nucleoside phosphorylase